MTLRIQRTDEEDLIVFAIAGRIQGEQVPELQALLSPELPHRDVVFGFERGEAGGPGGGSIPGTSGSGRDEAGELFGVHARVDFAREGLTGTES
jgi:hypothetical protein